MMRWIEEWVRSIVFYVVFYLGTVAYVLRSIAHMTFSPPGPRYRKTVRHWGRYHRWCVRHILGIKVVIEGEPLTEPAFYALKHESFFEAIDLPYLFQNPGVFAKKELLDTPLWGKVGLNYGLVPVERDAGAKALRAMLAAARKLAAQDRPLAIFPEGTRIPHGQRPPLQSGFAGLYKMLGMTVVPVAVNSGPLYHHWRKRRGTITIRFMEPIPPGLDRAVVEAQVQAAINALND